MEFVARSTDWMEPELENVLAVFGKSELKYKDYRLSEDRNCVRFANFV